MAKIVNSWNEWSRLRRVIVGRADGTMVQAAEPATVRDWPERGFSAGTEADPSLLILTNH